MAGGGARCLRPPRLSSTLSTKPAMATTKMSEPYNYHHTNVYRENERTHVRAVGWRAVSGFGFRVSASGFGLRASGFENRGLGSGVRASGSGLRVSDCGVWVRFRLPGFGFQASAFEIRDSGFGFRNLGRQGGVWRGGGRFCEKIMDAPRGNTWTDSKIIIKK